MGKNQHVVPNKGQWSVKGEGNKKNTVTTDTQQKAIEKAKQIAQTQKSEVVIHGRNGQIRDKDSYGKDSHPPKDKKF